jgi:hypothetical protein
MRRAMHVQYNYASWGATGTPTDPEAYQKWAAAYYAQQASTQPAQNAAPKVCNTA